MASDTSDMTPEGLWGDNRALERLVNELREVSLLRDREVLAQKLCRITQELVGSEAAALALREQDLCHYIGEVSPTPLWKGRRYPMVDCATGWCMERRLPCVVEDVEHDSRVKTERYRPTFIRSLLAVPIRTPQPIGALVCYWSVPHCPSPQEVRFLQVLMDTASAPLELIALHQELEGRFRGRISELEALNRRLDHEVAQQQRAGQEALRLSLSDTLTGLCNRRGFFARANQALRQARREGRTILLLYIDVDGLKQVNDEQGHAVGDALIQDAARVLEQTFRGSDIVARLGGDEFVVLVNDTEDGESLVERLQAQVAAFNQAGQWLYTLSISVGVVPCRFEGETEATLDQLLEQADREMYRTKRARRKTRSN